MAEQKKFADGAGIRLMLIGRGYVARHLVQRATENVPDKSTAIDTVVATYRPGGAPRVRGDVPFDDPTAVRSALDSTTHLLLSAAPTDAGDPLLTMTGVEELLALGNLQWIGYLSSTGVYGDHGGAWIDEEAERRATAPVSVRRLASEDAWLAARNAGLPVTLFRLSGIYGPGRSTFDALRKGTARRIDKPGQVFCRCHVDDICAVLERSMAGHGSHAVYNVADDLPVPQQEVVSYAAELLGVEPPPLVPYAEAELSPAGRRFYEASRRVGNDRIKSDLGVTLTYPTYRDGLDAILAEERAD